MENLKKDLLEVVGPIISSLRKEKGLSQNLLSRTSGLSRQQISKIETKKAQISAISLWELSYGLSIHPSVIMGLIDKELNKIDPDWKRPFLSDVKNVAEDDCHYNKDSE